MQKTPRLQVLRLTMLKTRSRLKIANNKKKENNFSSAYDPLGSYTGVCEKGEKPVQDADDL